MIMTPPDLSGLAIRTMRAETLAGDDRERVFALFDIAYRQANHAYLEKSLHQLRFLALADAGDVLAGFSFADMPVLDLHRQRRADRLPRHGHAGGRERVGGLPPRQPRPRRLAAGHGVVPGRAGRVVGFVAKPM